MERDSQIDRQAQSLHLFNPRNDAARGHRHIAVADIANIRLMQKLQGPEDRIKVQHGFAAAHDHNAADPFILQTQLRLEHVHLCQNFRNRQVPHSAMQSAGAKSAVHIAAGLAGNTDAVSVIMMHQDGFDGIPVRQLQ